MDEESRPEIPAHELEGRARHATEKHGGILQRFECLYWHSIAYSAQQAVRAFEEYDAARRDGAFGEELAAIAHTALIHSACLSKFFFPAPRGTRELRKLSMARAENLCGQFEVSEDSPLNDRALRDALEHFDERLDSYLLRHDAGFYIVSPSAGDVASFETLGQYFLRYLLPEESCYVLFGQRHYFAALREEVGRICKLAIGLD